MNVAVLGAGRMGQAIIGAIADEEELRLASLWTRRAAPADQQFLVSDQLGQVLSVADVAIDFSLPQATSEVLDGVLASGTPLVIGVSGLDDSLVSRIDSAAQLIPVLYDRNMSLGIAVLDGLLRQAAASLGPGFEAEIHERHHVHKVDAPSGTALQLGEALAAARNQHFETVKRYDPDGLKRPLKPGEIGFEVTRQGEVPGEHTVILYSDSERLELKHSVSDRRVFAIGALRGARWLIDQPAGLYRMKDIFIQSGVPSPA